MFPTSKNNPIQLINNLETIVNEFISIEVNTFNQRGKPNVNNSNYNSSKEHYYYWIRSKFNNSQKNTLEKCLLFYILK